MTVLKQYYLRIERPSFVEAYRYAQSVAKSEGFPTLSHGSANRRLNAEVTVAEQMARRGFKVAS